MRLWPDLSQRSSELELMDAPDSDRDQLLKTLEQFRWINRWLTACHRLMRRHVMSAMLKEPQRQWSFLDIGAGGCDVAVWLARWCRSHKISIQITCLDSDTRVIDYAREKTETWAEVETWLGDARRLSSRGRAWDFVFCNHFLHHLTDADLPLMLKSIDEVTMRTFVLSDIHRSITTYLSYSSLWPLKLTGSFAWYDGRLSIRKGFTINECRRMLDAAGVEDVIVRSCFPGHLAMIRNGKSGRY